jgi:hypothetical protein
MNELPALAKHTLRFYDALAGEAKDEIIESSQGKVSVPIWRGSLSNLWSQIGASNSYYSKVMSNLDKLNCINVLVRGSAGNQSVVAVIRRPHVDEIESSSYPKRDLTPRSDAGILSAEVEALKKNIGGIDIVEAFKNLEDRVSKLEREVGKVGKKSANSSS